MLTTLAMSLLAVGQGVEAPLSVHVDANQETAKVSRSMYGIFFEEINQAGEGGLYAELVRTRGMEDAAPGRLPTGWKALGDVTVDTQTRLNAARPGSLKIVRTSMTEAVGAVNEGFWGIPTEAGKRYRLTMWLRGDVPVEAALAGADGKPMVLAKVAGEGDGWRRAEIVLRAPKTDAKARLVVTPAQPGTVWLGYASLMPVDTWKGRENGFRRDLGRHIERIRPGFVRFPGGCFIEGHDLAQRFKWKDTVGPVESRPPMPRIFWGYPASNGLGYHEYLQWCEDLGAEALFVASAGMSHTQVAPMSAMGEYVQEALDAIEYAIGPITSKWGALRAKNGHPKPFNLKYVQIGNENGGPAYNERYALLYDAIKAKYPQIQTIACLWGGSPTSRPIEILDEHYYNNPPFFWRNANRYDSYDRKGPKIYVGEYAVTRGSGTGNLAAALSEAAFMAGMERNADIVTMGSYAPLFVNVNNRQWNPNAVVFDNHRSYGTPSYWVQQLFASNRPDRVVRTSFNAPIGEPRTLSGGIGIQTWRTAAEFKDVEVVADGKTVFKAEALRSDQVRFERGDWKVENGVLSQGSLEENRRAMLRDVQIPGAKLVSLRLKARKVSGNEGFIIMFGVSPDHEFQWNLGGWGNTVHAFQSDGDRTGRGVEGRIETGRWYDIRLEREGATTRAYLDGKLVETIEDRGAPDFTAVAGIDDKTKEIVIKAVNGAGHERKLDLTLDGARPGATARGLVLQGKNLLDENTFDQPTKISPRPIRIGGVDRRITLSLAPYSVTVLRIPRR